MKNFRFLFWTFFLLVIPFSEAHAQLNFYDAGANQGILDQVVNEFATRASAWQATISAAALRLFWILGTISLTWTGGTLILRKADIGEFFAEFVRFLLFFGFFLWLLQNGPNFANSIISSLRQLGAQATGTTTLHPSDIVNIGFLIWHQALHNLSIWKPVDSFIGIILSGGILLLLAAVAVNMLILLVTSWILMYAGIFFLGFGGSRWTSDMAINYYRTVLGIAAQLFAMTLLVGIGTDLLSTFYNKMNTGDMNFDELGVMLVFCLTLLLLTNKIPALIGGLAFGGGLHHSLGNGIGVGGIIGAASMGVAAAGTAYEMSKTAASNVLGGASAIMAAVSKASENVGSGKDFLSSFSGKTDSNPNSGTSPLGQPAGSDKNSASVLGKVGRFATDAAANLARGTYSVGKGAVTDKIAAAKENIRATVGGQIAEAIKPSSKGSNQDGPETSTQQQSKPIFAGDSLSGSNLSKKSQEEVAAFRDKQSS
ncbi:MAG: P-type conjugative transfer protein TrbL [Alphaproteobacteria bacterium]|nr:P-type conjugative transfer protein TrbL [Alphaproteobacteria bacterium]